MEEKFEIFCIEQREAVELCLESIFNTFPDTEVNRVVKYATLGGGHRWRALLAIGCASLFDGRVPPLAILRTGCVMELFHAASLILDDLPSMDDGRLRRGKPCVHLVHPRWAVDMASSYLITIGHQVLLTLPGVSPERCSAISRKAAETAITMCQGQEADLRCNENRKRDSIPDALERHRKKTGVLFGLAAASAAILADVDSSKLDEFGVNLGLAYQMSDDLADFSETPERLGKTCNQDADRVTPLKLLGRERSEELRRSLIANADANLTALGQRDSFLRHFTTGAIGVVLNQANA